MKSMLESWFSGILTPAEMISADRYSLFVGVVKKRYVWILLGILVCQTFFRGSCLRGGSLSCIYFRGHRLRTDDACGRFSGILRFFGLIFPQGIFFMLLRVICCGPWFRNLWRERETPFLGYDHFMMLGILTEIFMNPSVSALVFWSFSDRITQCG